MQHMRTKEIQINTLLKFDFFVIPSIFAPPKALITREFFIGVPVKVHQYPLYDEYSGAAVFYFCLCPLLLHPQLSLSFLLTDICFLVHRLSLIPDWPLILKHLANAIKEAFYATKGWKSFRLC